MIESDLSRIDPRLYLVILPGALITTAVPFKSKGNCGLLTMLTRMAGLESAPNLTPIQGVI